MRGRPGGRWRGALAGVVVAGLVGVAPVGAPAATNAAVAPVTVDGLALARPRILVRAPDLDRVRARLDREPYRTLVGRLVTGGANADGVALDNHEIGPERVKAKAAKDLAALYLLDRTLAGGVVVTPTPAERAAIGDRVAELLGAMYTRSRLAVPPPLGGYDRDINTSEELLQYATAYDALLGAGYDFGGRDATIRAALATLAGELWRNYTDLTTANGYSALLPNNHRSKSAAALGVAALALAPDAGSLQRSAAGPDGGPAAWLAFALDQVDLVQRYTYVSGDGAYAEGTYYLRYAGQNLLPFLRAWDSTLGGAPTSIAAGTDLPNLWRHPLFARSLRWELDLSRPNGAMAPVDDSNVNYSFSYGATAADQPDAAAFAWRWAHAPTTYDTDGSVDLAADALVAFDDTLPAAPPPGSPTAFYLEGGNAALRSGWGPDDTLAVVNAEHGTSLELGRDPDGVGRFASAAHEHADPGSFQLDAYGERLALNPGYLTYPQRYEVNAPEDHSIVLVDGAGPRDPFLASVQWPDFAGPPVLDGQAFLSQPIDSDVADGVRVRTRYGLDPATATRIDRRFLLVDGRYLVVDDLATSLAPHDITVLLHGNGGGTSGGTFTATDAGGEWVQGAGRLTGAVAFADATGTRSSALSNHEDPGRVENTHSVLRATAAGREVRSTMIAYPSAAGAAAPTVRTLAVPGVAGLVLHDPAGDRKLVTLHRAAGAGRLVVPGSLTAMPDIASDGSTIVVETHTDGRLRAVWADDATFVTVGTMTPLRLARPGVLGIRLDGDRAHVVTDREAGWVGLTGLPFTPTRVSGACLVAGFRGAALVRTGRSPAFTVGGGTLSPAPAADAGADRAVGVGAQVALDGRGSCSSVLSPLRPRWSVVSAPAGSSWNLRGSTSWRPVLTADRPGPYRVRLTVTDRAGRTSSTDEVVVTAGDLCLLAEQQGDPDCG